MTRRHLGEIALLALGAIGSVALAEAVRRAEDRALGRAVETRALDTVLDINHEFRTRLLALDRMAARWSRAEGLDLGRWREDATKYVAHFPGITALARVDASGQVEAMVPTQGNEDLVGKDLRESRERRIAMDEAWAHQRPAITPPIPLYVGGEGVTVYLPVTAGARFDGWIAGVFRISDFVETIVGTLRDFRVSLWLGERELYQDTRPSTEVCATEPLGVFYLGWQVRVCAAPELAAAYHGPLRWVSLAAGLAFTGLAVGLLRALGLAGERERRAEALAATLREKAEALDRAQRELAELSWSVSHELRTPLRAIDGHAALLGQEVGPEGQARVARIRINIRRLSAQLDGLLELLRVARTALHLADVDVGAIARARLADLAERDPHRKVEVSIDAPLRFRADPDLLATAVHALLDNAWKFTAGRDPAHIAVERVPGGFAVRDDGVGFDMAFRNKLFAAFERLHAPGEYEGLGLGLAIAARAVARHGGRILADAEPGRGATFRVELPTMAEAPTPPRPQR